MLIKKLNANQDCRDNIILKKNIQYLILLLLFFFQASGYYLPARINIFFNILSDSLRNRLEAKGDPWNGTFKFLELDIKAKTQTTIRLFFIQTAIFIDSFIVRALYFDAVYRKF